jgi:hypothetical protein
MNHFKTYIRLCFSYICLLFFISDLLLLQNKITHKSIQHIYQNKLLSTYINSIYMIFLKFRPLVFLYIFHHTLLCSQSNLFLFLFKINVNFIRVKNMSADIIQFQIYLMTNGLSPIRNAS